MEDNDIRKPSGQNGLLTTSGSLSLVRQEDNSGCGIACVAMLARCSYAHARKVWLCHGGDDFVLRCVNGGLSWYQLCHLMEVMGVKVPQAWETPRIVSIKGQPPLTNGHWVVVDDNGQIFDPANVEDRHEAKQSQLSKGNQ